MGFEGSSLAQACPHKLSLLQSPTAWRPPSVLETGAEHKALNRAGMELVQGVWISCLENLVVAQAGLELSIFPASVSRVAGPQAVPHVCSLLS